MRTRTTVEAIARFRQWLDENRSVLASKIDELYTLLVSASQYFDGFNETRMAAYKLSRMESPEWNPPFLSFRIERHGAMVVGGSTRAEIQTWRLDFDTRTATPAVKGYRQIIPRQSPLDVTAIAHEIAQSVATRNISDPRLRWKRNEVAIVLSQIDGLATGSAPAQTLQSRRMRFHTALVNEMAKTGFEKKDGSHYRFVPHPSRSGEG